MSVKNGELEIIDFDRRKIGKEPVRRMQEKRNGRRKKRLVRNLARLGVVLFLLVAVREAIPGARRLAAEAEFFLRRQAGGEKYPEKLLELVEKNEETLDFVEDYPNRDRYIGQTIDLSADVSDGKVPLLMQWDKRWGYDSYGEGMIGLEGCGPTCLAMAYLYLTGDLGMNPRSMAEFACENGYYSPEGTSWGLWTEGVERLGLCGKELPLNENSIKAALDAQGVVVCSMRPGDFTTTGHFILICGYDEKGFIVNDPNRRSNSEKRWDFQTISGQIKNLWGISRSGDF